MLAAIDPTTALPELTDDQFKELAKGIQIPPQPNTLLEVERETRKSEPSLHTLSHIVSRDVGVSAGILKAVNSPLFGMRKTISSIEHAVNLLGIRNIQSVVASMSLRESINKHGSPALDRFLDSANDCALVCSYLAKTLRIMQPEDAYTLGLFHDVGMPMMILRFPNYKTVLIEANQTATYTLTEVEDKHLGTNHAVVGYLVARSWKLPPLIANAIFNHHRIGELLNASRMGINGGGDDRELCAAISMLLLAEHISYTYRGRTDFHEWRRTGEAVLEFFDLKREEFDDLKEEVLELLRDDERGI
ncbi:HDOD domain-containing protein [Endothiovibrio diazotrophicus]